MQAQLGQRMEQRMSLLPQMLQSIEVLQLATVDLLALIEQELQANETLEAVAASEPELPAATTADAMAGDDGDGGTPRGTGDDEDPKRAFLESQPARAGGLTDAVREQLAWQAIGAEQVRLVMFLVSRLDERGLLPFALAGLCAEAGVDESTLREALLLLQSLEPRGLGAATAVEAMLLQLDQDPDRADLELLLTRHLEELARNRIPDVARAMGLTLEEVGELLQRVKLLNPRPAAQFHDEAAAAVLADASAWLQDGQVHVGLRADAVPELSVNADYEAMAADRSVARDVRQYLRGKVRSARDLIGAVQHRQSTLREVVGAIMRHQREFLRLGVGAIRPLRMSDLADELEVHTSTVSRAIAGKYVQTDRGVFRLRDFFDGGGNENGETAGRMAVRSAIGELVAAEDARRPLSDDDLVSGLAARGIHVARRTVTKYRKELDIPSSYLRKKHEG